jgi:nucleoside-diphosphate-sugar epimerase
MDTIVSSGQEDVMDWSEMRVLVTGGASFIGSHLVEALVKRGAQLRVVDDLSSGKLENIQPCLESDRVEFIEADLRSPGVADHAAAGMNVAFHLAADHGGRGYVELHQAACAGNLLLDGLVFRACLRNGVNKVVYASSGCVYPNSLQADPRQVLYLREEMLGPPYDADKMYGWAKLMGEMTLRSYYRDWGMKSACCRYFTVYGPRGVENHAVIALIARAYIAQDPFTVWGTGEQIRNWTYVEDIVEGTIRSAERINDGSGVNLGTMERTRVSDAVHMILDIMGREPRIEFHPEMPTGPLNRVADNSLAKRLLDWEPVVSFAAGVRRTIDWYVKAKNQQEASFALEQLLTERCEEAGGSSMNSANVASCGEPTSTHGLNRHRRAKVVGKSLAS